MDQFFSFTDPSTPQKQVADEESRELTSDEKKQRIQGIYGRMAKLEAFLNQAK
jgi:hypothetical protein